MSYKKILARTMMMGGALLGSTLASNSVFAAETTVNLNPYEVGDTTITGSYSGGIAAYEQLIIDEQPQQLVSMKNVKEGNISYYVGSTLKLGSNVKVVLYDANFKEIGSQSFQVKEQTKLNVSLNAYEPGDLTITGSYSGGIAAYEQLIIDEQPQQLVSMKNVKEGNISYYVGSTLKLGSNVKVVLYDANFKEIGSQSFKVTETQVFTLLGQGNKKMATLTVKDNMVTMQGAPELKAGLQDQVNPNFGTQTYFKIQFLDETEQDVAHYTWAGTRPIANKQQFSRELKDGQYLVITHAEAKTRYKTSNDEALKSSGNTFKYKMQNGHLELVE